MNRNRDYGEETKLMFLRLEDESEGEVDPDDIASD